MTVAVFTTKVVPYSDSVNIKFLGNVETENEIADEYMDLSKQKMEICSYEDNTVIAKFLKCRYSGNYISNKTLPVFYMSVEYQRNILMGFLFNVYLSIELDEESHNEMRTKLYDDKLQFKGKYLIEIDMDKELIEKIKEEGKEKYFEEFMGPQYINFKTVNKVINDNMLPFCKNEKFIELIGMGICLRDEERRKRNGHVFNFNVNHNTLNIKDIKSNPELLDRLLGL